VKRGEIWWANLPALAGRRPVVLVSRNEAYRIRALVTIAPVTTRVRGIPVEVQLGPREGLSRPCAVNCDSLATIPRNWLQSRLVALNPAKVQEINKAIKFALDLP
jgi:mRNA interferase MazF